MSSSAAGFTSTDLIAIASQVLAGGGYQQIRGRFSEWDTSTSRLFEDEYNVVGLVVFDTCGELLRAWPDLQGSLVEVISRHVGQGESKSWDGYLVLLSPGFAASEDVAIEAIRYNTTRLRKLIGTGEDLQDPMGVERVLRPLLPLESGASEIEPGVSPRPTPQTSRQPRNPKGDDATPCGRVPRTVAIAGTTPRTAR